MSLVSNTRQYEDFVGFTFNDIHSSDLHLFRVNDSGNRYTKDMVPAFQDKTVQVGGRDGTYLFGTTYSKRDISISVAFDDVGEEELRRIKTWGADKKIHKLIFDEEPYKYYNVKLSKSPQLKYICFDESENRNRVGESMARKSRIYKGEGTFTFVCYESFARSTILTKREVYDSEPDLIKIYLNKDCDNPFELQLKALDGVEEVEIYLCSDLYNRGQWGEPDMIDANTPALGQRNPLTGQPESTYYIYQPQRVLIRQEDLEATAKLISDYQTYLYPVNLQKGFVGIMDTKTGVTNTKFVDEVDSFFDNQQTQRRVELVQYDPCLKVTYGNSIEAETSVEEYGVYRFKYTDESIIEKIKVPIINKKLAYWNTSGLQLYENDPTEVCQDEVFETVQDAADYFHSHYSEWDENEINKMFVVKQSENILCTSNKHSLFLQPNHENQYYHAELRFGSEDERHIIRLTIDLVDEDDPILNGEDCISVARYCNEMCNYNEWIDYLGLPEIDSDWSGEGVIEIDNPGDWSMPFQAIYKFETDEETSETFIAETTLFIDDEHSLHFSKIERQGNDIGVIIDSNLRVMRGYTIDSVTHKKIPNNNIYDRYITAGDFFYIPCGSQTLTDTSGAKPELIYEYRYL